MALKYLRWKIVPLFLGCRCICVASISLFVVLMQFKWLDYTPNIVSLYACVVFVCVCVHMRLKCMHSLVWFFSPLIWHIRCGCALLNLSFSILSALSFSLSRSLLVTPRKMSKLLCKYWRLARKLGPNWIKPANRFVFTNKLRKKKHFQFLDSDKFLTWTVLR